ncbi:MAG TPA: hypothetical protein PK914_07750 [Smithellaceae bacterium]|nr:hypothetical protein [Smithellaceae bacterium]
MTKASEVIKDKVFLSTGETLDYVLTAVDTIEIMKQHAISFANYIAMYDSSVQVEMIDMDVDDIVNYERLSINQLYDKFNNQ